MFVIDMERKKVEVSDNWSNRTVAIGVLIISYASRLLIM